jgi:proteasome lid subunit RPN8/RPN11
MRIAIRTGLAETILAHAASEHPLEACGLLLGSSGVIDEVRPAANRSPTPGTHFDLDPTALLETHREARETGRQLLGWYHSHPNGRPDPSPADAAQAADPGKLWLIAADGDLRAFVWTGQGFEPCVLGIVPRQE